MKSARKPTERNWEMLKSFTALCAFGCFSAGLLAADAALPQPSIEQRGGAWAVKQVGYSVKKADGRMTVTVTRRDADTKVNLAQLQAFVLTDISLETGKKYQLEFQLNSPTDIALPVSVMISHAPYTGLTGKQVKLTAGKSEKVVLTFAAKKSGKDTYRMPQLVMGALPVGATVTISDVKLSI